jgi:hypothetical protein
LQLSTALVQNEYKLIMTLPLPFHINCSSVNKTVLFLLDFRLFSLTKITLPHLKFVHFSPLGLVFVLDYILFDSEKLSQFRFDNVKSTMS